VKKPYGELVERIRGEIADLDRVVKKAWRSWNQSKKMSNEQEVYLDSVALNLHGFYSGLERIFEVIGKHVDGSIPAGDLWHRSLLSKCQKSRKI